MRIAILQHSSESPPGTLPVWLNARGHDWRIHRLDRGEVLPQIDEIDGLVSLGGEMNCDEIIKYPFLEAEKFLLNEAIQQEKYILGICLGGQLLARALGASVKPHIGWEVGWHPVMDGNGESQLLFQWHQDTFELPRGAGRIFHNSYCLNQGFRFGERAYAIQFHPEATSDWILECAQENPYPVGEKVQSPEELRLSLVHADASQLWFFNFLDTIFAPKHPPSDVEASQPIHHHGA